MRVLRATAVHVELGRFKRKHVYCTLCKQTTVVHEEKETDVAIATKLFEVCYQDQCETVILMTGDTDLGPAVLTCKRLFPQKLIYFAFPYKRHNVELKKMAPESFLITRRACFRHQFPDPFILPDGTEFPKPAGW